MTKQEIPNNNENDIYLEEIKKLQNIIKEQTIQLSAIAAQMIEQNKKLNSITIQSEYIGVKELERRFDIKERSQKAYRGRVKNPLPFHQDVENGKISYKVSEVEEWKRNQKVR
jgi:hypothetical protein